MELSCLLTLENAQSSDNGDREEEEIGKMNDWHEVGKEEWEEEDETTKKQFFINWLFECVKWQLTVATNARHPVVQQFAIYVARINIGRRLCVGNAEEELRLRLSGALLAASSLCHILFSHVRFRIITCKIARTASLRLRSVSGIFPLITSRSAQPLAWVQCDSLVSEHVCIN